MSFGLKKNDLNRICEIFSKFAEVESAVVYGSRAKGNHKPGSDVDITLKGSALNLKILNSISNQIDDLLLPNTFDLSLYIHIDNADLISHIDRVGQVVFSK